MGKRLNELERMEKEQAKEEREKLKGIRVLLVEIQQMVKEIEVLDPYGDLIENFEDSNGTRVTRRLIDMIDVDLAK